MLPKEIVERIKHIQITTKRLLGGTRPGDHVSRQKGFGLDFDQIREYQQGDDVRYIDWKSSARTGKVLVKQYHQEHSRTIMLVVDCSASLAFGSQKDTKYQCVATVASILALIGHESKDRISLALFAGEQELYIPPRAGYGHVQEIMTQLFAHEPSAKTTNYNAMLRFIGEHKTNDMVIFLLSDFIGLQDEPLLRALAKSTELVAVRCLDTLERILPSVGVLSLKDIETGQTFELEARGAQLTEYNKLIGQRIEIQNKLFTQSGIDVFDVTPQQDIAKELVRFFRKRAT